MSKNGTDSENFHYFCDNKGPTLTLIKEKNNKIFGGFTPLSWNSESKFYKDESNKSFLFSLTLKKKYDIINQDYYTIHCYKDNGPYFGSSDLKLYNNMKMGQSFANNNCVFLSDHKLITGNFGDNEEFHVEELEVYIVKY